MIKSMGLAKRREGMSVEEFQAYWRDVHGPLVRNIPGIRRYIQCHTLPESYDAEHPPAWDGVAQLYFDSLEAMDEARRAPEWEALTADVPNFLGPGGRSIIAEERPIIDNFAEPHEREGMIKRMGFLFRKEGMSVEDFRAYWHDVHAPMVVKGLTEMRRYVQAHPLLELYGTEREPAADGVAESWWSPGLDQLGGEAEAGPDQPAAVKDLENFARRPDFFPIATREVVIIP